MTGYAYLDSSAIVKLVVAEAETPALENYLAACAGIATSRLAATEVCRAAARTNRRKVLSQAEDVLESFVLVDVTRAVLAVASRLKPVELRTGDAIHLVTALSLDLPDLEFVAYDDRLVTAARSAGLVVKQPRR
jgi:predicted nucleic acid-binding protein